MQGGRACLWDLRQNLISGGEVTAEYESLVLDQREQQRVAHHAELLQEYMHPCVCTCTWNLELPLCMSIRTTTYALQEICM